MKDNKYYLDEDSYYEDEELDDEESMDFDELKYEAEYLEELKERAKPQILEKLRFAKEKRTKEEFREYLNHMKDFSKKEIIKQAQIHIYNYSFDNIGGYEFMHKDKRVFVPMLGFVPTFLDLAYTIYATDPDDEFQNSKEFFYENFLCEIYDVFRTYNFEDDYDIDNLEELYKFMKTPKFDAYNNKYYPELVLVFDEKEHEVTASMTRNNKTIFEELEFSEVEKECEKLNHPTLETNVTPSLPKYEMER